MLRSAGLAAILIFILPACAGEVASPAKTRSDAPQTAPSPGSAAATNEQGQRVHALVAALGARFEHQLSVVQRKAPGRSRKELFAAWSLAPEREALAALHDELSDPEARRLAAIAYFTQPSQAHGFANPAEPATARALLEAEPPESQRWTTLSHPVFFFALAEANLGDAEAPVLDRFVAAQPVDVSAPVLVLAWQRAAEAGDWEAEARHRGRLLSPPFTATPAATIVALSPYRPLAPGREMPAFSVPTLEAGETLNSESLAGRPYLLEVWATWCHACERAMPAVHALHEEFGNAGLSVVSLSIDESPAKVSAWREGQWAMPWRHGWLDEGARSELGREWALMGTPLFVLVDAEGVIVASTPEIDVADLGSTVRGLLKE